MDLSCSHCQAKFKLPEEKVPKNQVFSIACPRCKEKMTVDTRKDDATVADKTIMDEVSSEAYNAADRPFDFIEEGEETALICESDETDRQKMKDALEHLGYHVTASKNARGVLKQMRFHAFDLVAINERFDSRDPEQNNILRHMERMSMDIRRSMYVVMISDRFRTMDNMAAFNRSVNLIVNRSNMDDFEKIVKKGLIDHTAFYKVFKDSRIKAGRA